MSDPKLITARRKYGAAAIVVYLQLLVMAYRDKGYYLAYGDSDRDGVIWCLDVTDFRKFMPAPLVRKLADTGSNIFTVGMLEKVIPDFDKMRELSDKPYAIFFEPSSMIDRIANQYALFSVVSDPSVLLSDILKTQHIPCRKIVIPKETKLEIRDKLDYINISERMIYPGLDGVCRWITRRYAALGPKYNQRRTENRE